ncbi:MAG: metallophosphoesterase [Candidatus Aenigmarchaeota archaeon]|nr:metallophosphoesterase [Candidatus Aenigmarchaeota archaeon]
MFIADKPVMKLGNMLVIADMHIGITKDIREKGILLPSQIKTMAAKLNSLKKQTRAKQLILLGDVKHHIPNISWQEEKEIPEFFSLLNFKKIILVKGNHDGRIERLVPPYVKVKKSYTYRSYAFTHGHRKIKTTKNVIVTGHNQPHVKFRDEMGATYLEPVWVKGPLKGHYKEKNLIMVPAFNELAGATIVNRDVLLGPIAKCLDKKQAHCYLLDGTDLGTINDLKIED